MDLTKEQLEQAWQLLHTNFGVDISEVRLLELAKILQMPIADLSSEEMDALAQKHERGWIYPISAFIAMRNAALQPKPDLREQIQQEIAGSYSKLPNPSQIVALSDRILAIIDAHKGGE